MSRKFGLTTIAQCIAKPSFKNLARLRVGGRDEWSRLSLPKLRSRINCHEIEVADLADAGKAAAYRWLLRGLPPEIAVKKVRIGIEIARRASSSGYDYEDEREKEIEYREQQRLEHQRLARERQELEQQEERLHSGQTEIVTYLAGAKYRDTSSAVVGPLDLEWEPTNSHDPNAIKVIQEGNHLGYVPKDIATKIRIGSSARLTAVGYPWTVIIQQPAYEPFILPKLLEGLCSS